jgi:hypothetical protein
MKGKWYFVDEEWGKDSNDGLSPETAFKTRQAAIDACKGISGEIIFILKNGCWSVKQKENSDTR